MSPKIKLVALDLDGTLFTDTLEITEENQRAIRTATDAGVHIIISTGRPYVGLPIEKLTKLGIRYAITANGGGIYRIPERKCVYSNCMPPEVIVPIIRKLQTFDIQYDAYIEGGRFRESNRQHIIDKLTHFPDATRIFVKNNAMFVEDLAAYIEKQNASAEKMTINFYPLTDGTYKDRNAVWEYLSSNPQVTALCGGYMNIEYTMAGTTKAIGLAHLADILGIPMECTMAIGDTQNDADIVQAAAIGVAMGNAANDLKNIADFITKSNNESGVAYAINKFVFHTK